jgi:hypothetical protein
MAAAMGALSHMKAVSGRNFESVFPLQFNSKAPLLKYMRKWTAYTLGINEDDQRDPKHICSRIT